MNAKFIKIFTAAMLVLSLAACSHNNVPQQTNNYLEFADHYGNHVVLPHKPQRVAVLFSSFADIWCTAGGTVGITVGESVERGFVSADAVLVDGGAGKKINTELLIASKPDFVICSADVPAQTETAQLLKNAGIPCAVFRVETFSDYLNMLKICTDITGNTELYTTFGTDVQAKIETVLHKTDIIKTNAKILFIRAGSGASATKAKTANDHFAAAMLKELGTYNIAENAKILLDGLSIEEIITENPEYIFISTMGDETAAKEYIDRVFSQPEWQVLSAVKNKKYYFLPKELFQYKPNSRWDKAYEYLTDILYE